MIKRLHSFKEFIRSKLSPGIMLMLGVVLSLGIANLGLNAQFNSLLDVHLGINSGGIDLDYTLLSWINDGLMAIFFLLVGLEIK